MPRRLATATVLLSIGLVLPAAAQDLTIQTVNQAKYSQSANQSGERSPVVLKAQVLLDWARFSPGVIDGYRGGNFTQALAAFEKYHGLEVDGRLDQKVWDKLAADDRRPVLKEYTLTDDDVNGPFVDTIPDGLQKMAELERLAYTGPQELLAEKFHMDLDLLRALNPKADFRSAGTTIVVAAAGEDTGSAEVSKVEVDKDEKALRAYTSDGKLVAFYPATIGSEEKPAPDGTYEVRAVAADPAYYYNPDTLNFDGVDVKSQVKIAPGPNNPVGTVWIDLSKDGYGIHGTPEPAKIGKTYSHGCVRLTNWDAEELSQMVKRGTTVRFLGA